MRTGARQLSRAAMRERLHELGGASEASSNDASDDAEHVGHRRLPLLVLLADVQQVAHLLHSRLGRCRRDRAARCGRACHRGRWQWMSSSQISRPSRSPPTIRTSCAAVLVGAAAQHRQLGQQRRLRSSIRAASGHRRCMPQLGAARLTSRSYGELAASTGGMAKRTRREEHMFRLFMNKKELLNGAYL